MNEQEIQHALNGVNVNIDALERAGFALSVGNVTYIPRSGEKRELLNFQLFMEDVRELAESKQWRKVNRYPLDKEDTNTLGQCDGAQRSSDPGNVSEGGDSSSSPNTNQEGASAPSPASAASAAAPVPDAVAAAPEPTVVRELGTPRAAAPKEAVEDPGRYNADLPQGFEFLRESLTLCMKAGADQAIIQMLLNGAVEARDYGMLKEWKQKVVPGVAANLHKGRHPNESVPAMLNYLRTNLLERNIRAVDEDTQRVLREIAHLVPDAHKGTHHDFVDDAIASGKVKHFVPCWDETRLAMDQGRVSAPWSFWRKIVNERFAQEEADLLRQPIKLPVRDAVSWVKPWLPTFDPSLLNRENIEQEYLPFTKRITPERRVEAAYFTLRTDVQEKGLGVPVDALVHAWSGPECAGPELMSLWVNGLDKEYERDGKRFGFSQQHVDINASAFFLDVLRRENCQPWVEAHREALKNHPKIGTLYAQVFPPEKDSE